MSHGDNHPICEACWVEENTTFHPDGSLSIRTPVLLHTPHVEHCCRCGAHTIIGLYVRRPADGLLCDPRHHPQNRPVRRVFQRPYTN